MEYNIYCDESLHLPNDGSEIMVIGGIWGSKSKTKRINKDIKKIKERYNIGHEMKWVKVSNSKKEAYKELINYFFDCEDLHFRVMVVDNKNKLQHEYYNQTHDDWYYKMFFHMLNVIFEPKNEYNIYLDIKDTKSKSKLAKLKNVLVNSKYDLSGMIIKNMQVIRSDEVEVMQLVDVLIGAVSYHCRRLNQSRAKMELIELVKARSHYSLDNNSLLKESKFNIFHMQMEERRNHGMQI